MAFKSLSDLAARHGRLSQTSYVMVSQSMRAGSGALELTFRLSAHAMEKIGARIGSKVDILYDEDADLWMIKKMPEGNGGFSLSGQKNKAGHYSTAAARLTWRQGFPLLTNEDEDREKTVKKGSVDERTVFDDGSITFKLA